MQRPAITEATKAVKYRRFPVFRKGQLITNLYYYLFILQHTIYHVYSIAHNNIVLQIMHLLNQNVYHLITI